MLSAEGVNYLCSRGKVQGKVQGKIQGKVQGNVYNWITSGEEQHCLQELPVPKGFGTGQGFLGKSIARRSERGFLVSNVSIFCEFNLRVVTLNSLRMLTSRGALKLADWSSSSSSSSPAFHTESNATTASFHSSRTRLTSAN